MDKIICLVGESGSGKSTIAELLEQKGFNYIQSYTTRKPRFEGEKGHIFISKEASKYIFNREIYQNNIIAYTFFDNEHYWATRDQYKDKGTSIYVIDVKGIKELIERVKDAEIIVIYLKVDKKNRIERMCKRECKSIKENITVDMCSDLQDRLIHDKEVFNIVPCDYCVDANRTIEEVLNDVYLIIRSENN